MSSFLERLNSYAGLTPRLGPGIMVRHYKFIILMEVLESHASDDRPHTTLSSGFKHEAHTSPCTRRTGPVRTDYWGVVGSLLGIITVRDHVRGVRYCYSVLWLFRQPIDVVCVSALCRKYIKQTHTRQAGEHVSFPAASAFV
jgi:hypothetical protein